MVSIDYVLLADRNDSGLDLGILYSNGNHNDVELKLSSFDWSITAAPASGDFNGYNYISYNIKSSKKEDFNFDIVCQELGAMNRHDLRDDSRTYTSRGHGSRLSVADTHPKLLKELIKNLDIPTGPHYQRR